VDRGEPNRAVTLDVVIPVFNEEEALPVLLERLRAAFAPERLREAGVAGVRHVLVDDGSSDRSAALVADAIAAGFPALLLRFSRNFGHQSAVSAGLSAASADLVAILDADLQDPPELVLAMVAKWREGADVVYAQRRRRTEGPLKRASYWLFYRLVAFLADVKIPLDSGDFCLLDRRVVRAMSALPERLRFPRVLRAWVGFRQVGIAYDRPARQAGSAKYTFSKLYRLATDGVVSASVRPLQLAQVFSVTYLLVILGLGALLLARVPLWSSLGVPAWALVSYLLILSGNFVQVFCMYILGAYVGRTYLEAKGRPPYVIMEVVGARDGGDGKGAP
jgi:dolichol-phosphate mannosyltransferase